jgi:hypothetical protein
MMILVTTPGQGVPRPHACSPGEEKLARRLAARPRRNLRELNQPRSGNGVTTKATGTFAGEMTLPDGTVIAPTGKAFDVEFGQTTKWDGDRLIVISAFYDAALQRQQIGLA